MRPGQGWANCGPQWVLKSDRRSEGGEIWFNDNLDKYDGLKILTCHVRPLTQSLGYSVQIQQRVEKRNPAESFILKGKKNVKFKQV